MTTDKKSELRDLIDDAVKGRIDTNRRFDDVLEKIQGQNHQFSKSSGTSCGRWRSTKKWETCVARRTTG